MQFLGSIGALAFILGVGSFILEFFNMQFSLLGWIYNWGPTNALFIKIGLIVGGAILWFLGNRASDGLEEE